MSGKADPGSGGRTETAVFVSLGTNIGGLEANLQRAVELIGRIEGVGITGRSAARITRPVGRTDQPDFLNQVLKLSTSLAPEGLLERLLAVEREMGRVRGERWAPRIIDLDILFYGELREESRKLVIPHPELINRPFFLEMVDEIAPGFLSGWPKFQVFRERQGEAPMQVVKTKDEVRELVARARQAGHTVGLVPTMGFFHAGHLSLMRICRREAEYTVVSLFVNPTQFSPGEDLERYPRDLARDREMARKEGVDLLFAPEADQMYAGDSSTFVEETRLSRGLCGASRPGHFRGVATVVTKLLNIVQPEVAVFGRKDLQQLLVIRRLVRDLDLPVRIVAGRTVREPDGLAMSSRNRYLGQEERSRAAEFYRALTRAAQRIGTGGEPPAVVLPEAAAAVESATGGRIEYLEALDETLSRAGEAAACRYLAGALQLGGARLIDNVDVPPG